MIRLPGCLCLLGFAAYGSSSDRAAGEAIFKGKGDCLSCHAVDGRGGSLGPELGEIGVMRTPESLRLAITEPDSEIRKEYLTVVIETREGLRVEGIALNEDDLSIQVRQADGTPRSFLKENLKDVHRERRSLMPSYTAKLLAEEIDSLVAYLRTLKGEPVKPGPPVERTRTAGRASENVAWMTRPERDAEELPDTLLSRLRIPSGATVVDLGAGTGYFTWRLALQVGPRGRVIAVDVQQKMLDLNARELKKRGVPARVDLVLGGDRDPRLPQGAVDLVLIANAYHEFSDPAATMAAVRRSLKPDGRVVILEYIKEDVYSETPGLHKMTSREIRAEIEPMGFQLDFALDFLALQHGLIFIKSP
jgi:putative heme-binding domain-containing protein